MNREILFRAVLSQWLVVVVLSLALLATTSGASAMSAFLGGACVAVPYTLLAMTMAVGRGLPAWFVLVGEVLKVLSTFALLVLVARLCVGLSWPALLAGVIAAVVGSFALLLFKN